MIKIRCDPTLLEVCRRVRYNRFDETVNDSELDNSELDDNNSYWQVCPAKLGKAVLVVPTTKDLDKEDEQYVDDTGCFVWVTVIDVVPIFDYDKERHADLHLVTLSDDLDIEYPTELHIDSMHRFSAANTMPPLKGVKKLYIRCVANSLDFTHTTVEHVVIDNIQLFGDPDQLNDYDSVFPKLRQRPAYRNPPCTITCKTIEVKHSDAGMSHSLHYNCDTLILDQATKDFTSSCRSLILRPSSNLLLHHDGDSIYCNLPNLPKLECLRVESE